MEALRAQRVKDGRKVVFADEMRIGMIGQVRRKWFLRGYKPRERVERQFVWRYLQLAVQPLTGEIGWRRAERTGGEEVAAAVKPWQAAGIEADPASHRALCVKGVHLLPYSPESCGWVFEEVRRWIEGRSYGSIEAKVAAVESFLRGLAEDKARVRRLTGVSSYSSGSGGVRVLIYLRLKSLAMRCDTSKHHRRNIRLRGYDHSQPGAYFITICTRDRMCIFGEIVNGVMHLNEAGHIVAWTWQDLPHHVPNGIWDAFVVMPNRVHGTIIITSRPVGAGSEPAPTGPAPTKPAPTEPAPTEPAPTEPLIRPLALRGYGRDSKRLRMV